MSWWDAKHLTSFATQAFKTAQKKIDKVLDIKEDNEEGSLKDKNEDGFFNKWLSPENMLSSSSSSSSIGTILTSSSKEKLEPETKSDWTKQATETNYEEQASVCNTEVDKQDLEVQNTETLTSLERKLLARNKTKKSMIGSNKSAFKKFKEVREQQVEEKNLPTTESFDKSVKSDIFTSEEENFSDMTKHKLKTDDTNSSIVCDKTCDALPNRTSADVTDDKLISTTIDNNINRKTEIDASKSENVAIKFAGKDDKSEIVSTMKSIISQSFQDEQINVTIKEQEPVGYEQESRDLTSHNLLDMTSDIDISSCWSDASLSQVVTSTDLEVTFNTAIKCGEAELFSSFKDETVSTGEQNDSNNVTLASREVISEVVSEKFQAVIATEDLSEITSWDAGQAEISETKDQEKTVEEDVVQTLKTETSEDFPSKKESLSSASCIAESASGVTLVSESSLENSTSDDMSESNKTLTGDEGVSTLLSNMDVCNLESDETPHCNFIIGYTDTIVEKTHEGVELEHSPDECQEVLQEMIEEAMDEGLGEDFEVGKPRNENIGSPGEGQSSEKLSSEVLVPAESGQTSGHTSADEIDTTTSSDIEIISQMSTPSFMGSSWRQPASDKHPVVASSGAPSYCDLSPPSKRTMNRAGSPSGVVDHRRSDSSSSGQSLQSRNGEDFVSIDYVSIKGGFVDIRHRKCPPPDVSHQLALLSNDNESLLKKVLELEEVVEARERKVLELSHENIELQEGNSILRNQLAQVESLNEAEKEDLQSLSGEFAKRITDSEKKLQAALKERDALKRTLVEAELEKKSNNVLVDKLVREKEQTIAELMTEGEKLSKQQLQISTAVKKLRCKDKENETAIKSLKDKNEDQKAEVERLEGILETQVEAENKYVDTINQMNNILKSNEDEISRLKNDLEDALEKCKSFKIALDNSYKEMSELHRARMTDMTVAQQAAAAVEMSTRDQLMQSLDEQKLNARKIENQLILQIEDLQMSMTRMDKDHGRRNVALRQEISDLQERLQEAEERNQELTRSVSIATRPLLRQIENIQSTCAVQSNNFERIEKNLSERLAESQSQLVGAVEKERIATDNLSELAARLESLDIQVSSLRQDKARLQAELEMERSKLGALEETKHIIIAQKEFLIVKLEEEIKDVKKEKLLLGNQVEMERLKVDSEKKKYVLVSDQLKEKEIQLQTWSLKSTPTPQPSDDVLKNSTPSTPVIDDYRDRSLSSSRLFYSDGGSRQSVYESIRGASGSTVIENLQSQLKLREGEIGHLQSNVSELERTRESLSRELVNVSTLNEDIRDQLESLSLIEIQFQDVSQRHNALLQMYGEKVEEAEELRMDLQDIKEIYKCQMDDLLKLKSQSIPS